VLLGLEGEGVRVHTGARGAGVVLEGLHLVEILASLLLEAVLAVEHQLEGIDGARELLRPSAATIGTREKHGRSGLGGGHQHVATVRTNVRGEHGGTGGEVPQVGARHGTMVGAEDQLLHGVVVGQTDLLGLASGGEGVRAGVLQLLDQVLMPLLGEATTLLGVEVHVVAVDLEGGAIGVLAELRREVEIQAHLVVLEGDQGQSQSRVAVEEEDQGQEHGTGDGGTTRRKKLTRGGHLTPRGLLALVQVQLAVQTPPALVVLVDALATDGQLDILDGTLGAEHGIVGPAGLLREVTIGDQLDVHVGDKITVAGHGHGHAAVVGSRAVHGLLDILHSEVSVAAVNGLEESNLGVASQVDILGTVSDKLHETSSHCLFCTIGQHFISARKIPHNFSHVYFKCQSLEKLLKILSSLGRRTRTRRTLVMSWLSTRGRMETLLRWKLS
jgi:hypothetical protein